MRKFVLLTFSFASLATLLVQGQAKTSAKTSDAVVVYDISTYQPASGNSIPFDKRFTLQIPHAGSPSVTNVYLYKANFDGGERQIETDATGTAYPDLPLPFKVTGDTLNIYFPALKPSVNFEVAVVSGINGSNLQLAHKVNEDLLATNWAAAYRDFHILNDSAADNSLGLYFIQYNFFEYTLFYTSQLSSIYRQLHGRFNYLMPPFPTIGEVNALEHAFSANNIKFTDNRWLVRVLADASQGSVLNGRLPLKYANATQPADESDFITRMANLQTSMTFFDTLAAAVNESLAIANDNAVETIRNKLNRISQALSTNKKFISDRLKQISTKISANPDMASVNVLVGSTIAKDIKTAGGNIITMDLGVTNIITRDVKNTIRYIPKPYYGLNIYFRPINKDTREKDFLQKNGGDGIYRSRLVSENDVLEHLSFCIGLTFTAMTNSEFDNLFNSATLLLGPGYRWGRFVKIGAGLALLKRISKDPLISEKKVIGGFYVSLSADVDVVQGVKDFTQLIFK